MRLDAGSLARLWDGKVTHERPPRRGARSPSGASPPEPFTAKPRTVRRIGWRPSHVAASQENEVEREVPHREGHHGRGQGPRSRLLGRLNTARRRELPHLRTDLPTAL